MNSSQAEARKDTNKQKILTHSEPSVTQNVSDAVTIKDGNLFLVAKPDGKIPLKGPHGYGLYLGDTRFLSGYKMSIAGQAPLLLAANSSKGFLIFHQLTNPRIKKAAKVIDNQKIGIQIFRHVRAQQQMLHEIITFENYYTELIEFNVTFTFQADFADVFCIRGLYTGKLGCQKAPVWRNNALFYEYVGKDGLNRGLSIFFTESVLDRDSNSVTFSIKLEPQERKKIAISYLLAQSPQDCFREDHTQPDDLDLGSLTAIEQATSDKLGSNADQRMESDDILLNHAMKRALTDIRMLTNTLHGKRYLAAGIPWFATLFGRDSLIAAMQTLHFDSDLARETLELLSQLQGQEVNSWKDEEPGKILHELRMGELARLNETPHNPFYGTCDATPLFLILLACYVRWTGDLEFFRQLQKSVTLALRWIDQYSDTNGDGFSDYESPVVFGLINQGWKDSGNAILDEQGLLAQPPIALVEMQGYVYRAKLDIADVYRLLGRHAEAQELVNAAKELKDNFNKKFWMEDEGTFALAIDGRGKALNVVTSNPGHALWTEIADARYVQRCIDRMMQKDLFSGWGLRTLSTKEAAYNPVGYHRGTVWPHDNSMFMSALKKHGRIEEATGLFHNFLEASLYFENGRLPELFSGFPRGYFEKPVPYPVACHPQAWAAGSLPFMLSELLGLRFDLELNKLFFIRPILPRQVRWLKLRQIQVGQTKTDLTFEATKTGKVHIQADPPLPIGIE